MPDLIKEGKHIARKEYHCDACEHITADLRDNLEVLTFSEKRAVVRARSAKWRIQKGQKYIRQVLIHYGDFYEFKAIPDIHAICHRLGMYDQ